MSVLEFEAARLHVRLGCTADERRIPQAVDLGIRIRFAQPPSACETDALKDTVCYAELIELASDIAARREFQTIERLARELYVRIRPMLPADAELWLKVTKVHPPVAGLTGGVSFSLGDPETDSFRASP